MEAKSDMYAIKALVKYFTSEHLPEEMCLDRCVSSNGSYADLSINLESALIRQTGGAWYCKPCFTKGTNGEPLEGDVNWNVDVKPIGSFYISGQIVYAAIITCAAQSPASEMFGKDKSTGHPSCEGLNKPDNVLKPVVFADKVENLVTLPMVVT